MARGWDEELAAEARSWLEISIGNSSAHPLVHLDAQYRFDRDWTGKDLDAWHEVISSLAEAGDKKGLMLARQHVLRAVSHASRVFVEEPQRTDRFPTLADSSEEAPPDELFGIGVERSRCPTTQTPGKSPSSIW